MFLRSSLVRSVGLASRQLSTWVRGRTMQQQHNDAQVRRSTRGRHAALALVLAMLAVLAIAATASAYVARRTETTLDDFNSGNSSRRIHQCYLTSPCSKVAPILVTNRAASSMWSAINFRTRLRSSLR